MKKQRLMLPPEEHSGPPEIDLDLRECYEMTEEGLKIVTLRKLN